MAYILNIETTSTNCSVALAFENNIIASKHINEGFTHIENLHPYINHILTQSHISIFKLQAIAISSGPGSYTGLRIGYATAKGLSFALNIPIISICTLQAMTHQVFQLFKPAPLLCPMIDAKRMEIYTALYDEQNQMINPVKSIVINDNTIQQFSFNSNCCFFGDGVSKIKNQLSQYPSSIFIENIIPNANMLCELAFKKFQNKQFENTFLTSPNYLKPYFLK